MTIFYATFGQGHTHSYNGKTLDKDTVVRIRANSWEEGRETMFRLFGQKWSMFYEEIPNMRFFPKGIVDVE